jgi:hypothetical protein
MVELYCKVTIGYNPGEHRRFDIPGVVPIVSGPADMVIFGSLVFHGVLPFPAPRGAAPPPPRLLLGLRFRPRPGLAGGAPAPWPLSELARRFIAAQPASVQPLLQGYTGLKIGWAPGDTPAELANWARNTGHACYAAPPAPKL